MNFKRRQENDKTPLKHINKNINANNSVKSSTKLKLSPYLINLDTRSEN